MRNYIHLVCDIENNRNIELDKAEAIKYLNSKYPDAYIVSNVDDFNCTEQSVSNIRNRLLARYELFVVFWNIKEPYTVIPELNFVKLHRIQHSIYITDGINIQDVAEHEMLGH